MSATRIASRYAKSLIELAQEKNALEAVYADMDAFGNLIKERDLFLFLKSPIIPVGKKAQIFKAMFDGKVNEITGAFFNIVVRKGRESYLPEITNEFLAQYKKLKGISSVKLTTASPLSAKALEDIKSKLLASAATASEVEIETAVDEDLIGGFIIKIGDKQIDTSVASKLKELSKTFNN